ncbi:MAG: TonB-dependent receptor [Prevotellaceae bacterium]|nr:TonB-dependent receptor [Prevotellaceae bacterium]
MKKLSFASLLCLSCAAYAQEAAQDSITHNLGDVVVTATRTEVNRSNVPMTISVVGREEIEQSGESSALSALSGRVPGLFITERGVTGFGVSNGGTGGISIRGVGGSPTTEVLVLIDGHPQYMGVMGHPLPDAYIASDVERIEVIRGPASVLYGSNAMGGVINLISRRQTSDGWKANARLMYGSFNTQKYSANAGINKNSFDGFISVNHDRTDGHRDNSPFNLTGVNGRVGYRPLEQLYVHLDANVASYMAQNPGEEAAPVFDNIADILRGEAALTVENHFDKNGGTIKLFYNFGDHYINDGYYDSRFSTLTPQVSRPNRFKSNDHNYGVLLYQSVRLFKGNTITAGIDYKNYGGFARQVNAETGDVADVLLADTSFYEAAGYLTVQQTLFDRFTLNVGGRYEHNQLYGGEWAPQAGITYAPQKTTILKASVAKGYRSPTLRDIFMFVPVRNPDLKPERMWNYEVSWEQKLLGNRLSFELTGFIADGSGLIQRVGNQNVNSGNFRNTGAEVAVKYQPLQHLHLHGSYSYLHMPADKRVAYAPEQMAELSAAYAGLKKWNFNAGYRYVKDVYSNVSTGIKSSYGLLDAQISYRPLQWLNVFVKGENLTDKKYEIVTGYPMPGITVMGGVSVSLGSR